MSADEDRVKWFTDFCNRIEDEDLKGLTVFLEDLHTKFKINVNKAYINGYTDGKEINIHGTH